MGEESFVRNENLSFFQKDDGRVIVFNHDDAKSHILSYQAYQFLLRLDGEGTRQDLYSEFAMVSESEIDQMIDMFEKIGLIGECHEEKKRFVLLREPENTFILKNKTIRSFIRGILLISPFIFCMELFYLRNLHIKISLNMDTPFLVSAIIIFIVSLCAHEMSHAVFAKSYNANIGEIGLLFEPVLPFIRIYTSICGFSYITRISQKIKTHLAGILAHFFLMDISIFIIGSSVYIVNQLGLYIFFINCISVSVDLLPLKLSDGTRVFKTVSEHLSHYSERIKSEKI